MSDSIITVEKLGKKYSLRHQRAEPYTALRDVITERAKSLFARNGKRRENRSREDFWALKDLSFEVKQAEVLGIIGRNGAGKSTLLKILSRITDPTEGRIRIKGRVASLLEVGTGFHPELTGRENIYLNGAILGMHRAEIKKKFDEIVAFAETEKFLDTPVKRYSSGMYVRLAFAVAAHLEPEILVVDEVLAVGDSEFQNKCLGKMQDVARSENRTVLFVSHNMAAIRSLTRRCVLLDQGRIAKIGETEAVAAEYARVATSGSPDRIGFPGSGEHTTVRAVRLIDREGKENNIYEPHSDLCFQVDLETDGSPGLSIDFFLCDSSRSRIAFCSSAHFSGSFLPLRPGVFRCDVRFPKIPLAAGSYSVDLATAITNVRWDHYVEAAVSFAVSDYNPSDRQWVFRQNWGYGTVALVPQGDPLFVEISEGCQGALRQ